MKVSAAAALPFLHHEPDFQDIREMLEREMRCSLVGAQPVHQFLDSFLPLPSDVDPTSIPVVDFSKVKVSTQEKDSYAGLVCVDLVSHCPTDMMNSTYRRSMLSMALKLFLASK